MKPAHTIQEDLYYGGLDDAEKETIRQEAIADLQKSHPQFDNPKIAYTREILIEMRIREIIQTRLGGWKYVK